MAKLGMKAVIYLNNFWDWSGGMMVYVNWITGQYIKMGDPAFPWPAYPDAVSAFYTDKKAMQMSHDYLRAVVTRTNTITGVRYVDDPAIMAWQLCNEPRPGESKAASARIMPDYLAWIRETSGLIKSLDNHHMVSIGSEGTKGCVGSTVCVTDGAAMPDVDYMTIHIWPQNFGWLKPADMAGTWDRTEKNTRDYITQHVALARSVGKPLVIEEFGFPRDGLSFDAGTPTTYKDRYYKLIYDSITADAAAGGPLAGSNFWAWSGEGRAEHGDHHYRQGDTSYLGDPCHEPQGWYSVFDVDRTTRAVVAEHAQALLKLSTVL
jgi:mannan endo-1,4-beta-mannosidase